MIEGTDVEIEGGIGDEPPYETKAFLKLEGDFVVECEKYILKGDATHMVFELPSNMAHQLHEQLGKVLYG